MSSPRRVRRNGGRTPRNTVLNETAVGVLGRVQGTSGGGRPRVVDDGGFREDGVEGGTAEVEGFGDGVFGFVAVAGRWRRGRRRSSSRGHFFVMRLLGKGKSKSCLEEAGLVGHFPLLSKVSHGLTELTLTRIRRAGRESAR